MFDFVSERIQEYLNTITPKHLVYIETTYRGNKLHVGILGGPKMPCKRCFELKDSIPYQRIYGGRYCYKCIIDFLLRNTVASLKLWDSTSVKIESSPQRGSEICSKSFPQRGNDDFELCSKLSPFRENNKVTYSSYLQMPPEEVMNDIYDVVLSSFTSPSYNDICKVVNGALCTFETAEAYLFRCGNDVQKAIEQIQE
jgi:hypothetical protein